jgi:hypothetical protein
VMHKLSSTWIIVSNLSGLSVVMRVPSSRNELSVGIVPSCGRWDRSVGPSTVTNFHWPPGPEGQWMIVRPSLLEAALRDDTDCLGFLWA